jgi:prolyl oligopeptidase
MLHGIAVEDPFRWLEDQDSPETRAFLHAEEQNYRGFLDQHRELSSRIGRRVSELLTAPTVDLPVPDHRGGLIYLKRETEQEQKAIYCQDQTSSETLLIHSSMLGRDAYTSLAIVQVSPDGRYLVFGIRTGGEDVQEIGIYDLSRRQILRDRLPHGYCRGVVFDNDAGGFYYVHEEASGRYQLRHAVRWHEFDDDQSDDREIYHAGDGSVIRLILRQAEDGSALGYLIFSLESVSRTRFLIHKFPLNKPPQEVVDLHDVRFGMRFWSNSIEAITDYAAPLGRIVRFPLGRSEPQQWIDIIPETAECLSSWEPWGGSRLIHYTTGSRAFTKVYSGSGMLTRTIEYPASGTSTLGQLDASNNRFYYSHSDINKPPEIYAVDLIGGEHRLWWQQPNSICKETLESESQTYASRDGREIRMTLIHPRGAEGVRPVLLSAYGGGGVSSTPKFSALLSILVESGFTCATAHVRGGGEGGLQWHLAARKQLKQTSVDDLLYAARWLIASGYTTAEHLGVAGQSNGALLTLCAITQQPELFRAALALGPISDLTRFQLFGVARGFVAELGSPDDPDEFAALYRLSPYHHVSREAEYPAVLIVSGDRDKRCDSLHARKMVAQLRAASSQRNPTLLDYTETRGHKPVLPLAERIRALTNRLTFLIAELEIELPKVKQS